MIVEVFQGSGRLLSVVQQLSSHWQEVGDAFWDTDGQDFLDERQKLQEQIKELQKKRYCRELPLTCGVIFKNYF